MKHIKPCGNYILLRAVNPPGTTIELDQVHPNAKLIVEAVGPEAVGKVSVGDRVLCRPNFNGLTPKGEKMLTLVDAGAVIAILVEDTIELN